MIKIDNLSKSFVSGIKVLDGLSLTIPDSGVHGLVGPNGAGKTTLISILNGILKWEEGSVFIKGLDLKREKKKILHMSSLVPQTHAFYNKLSVKENLSFFIDVMQIDRVEKQRRLENAIHIASLENLLHKRAAILSGGQKRRLNLAIGLLSKPGLLYLDEPTVGIDPRSRREILSAIKNIASEGMVIVFASHYLEEVEEICDTVSVLDSGKIQLITNMDQPSSPYPVAGADKERLIIEWVGDYTPPPGPEGPSIKKSMRGKTRIATYPEISVKNALPIIEKFINQQQKIVSVHFGKKSLNEIYTEITEQDAAAKS